MTPPNNSRDLNSTTPPWWGRNLLATFMLAFTAMLAAQLGFLVSPESRAIEMLVADHRIAMAQHLHIKSGLQIDCYNRAELLPDPAMRARHQRRCITLQIDVDETP